MKKKEYIRPESAFITLGDELMDLGGLSVLGKNPDDENLFIGISDDEGNMESEGRSKFIKIWDDDLAETEDEW